MLCKTTRGLRSTNSAATENCLVPTSVMLLNYQKDKHMQYLRRITFNWINILRSLSQKRYGSRVYRILILAICTIRSLKLYRTSILNKTCYTVIKNVEVLQSHHQGGFGSFSVNPSHFPLKSEWCLSACRQNQCSSIWFLHKAPFVV